MAREDMIGESHQRIIIAWGLVWSGFWKISCRIYDLSRFFLMCLASVFGENCPTLDLLRKVNIYDSWCIILPFMFSMLWSVLLWCCDDLDLLRCCNLLWCCCRLFYFCYNDVDLFKNMVYCCCIMNSDV